MHTFHGWAFPLPLRHDVVLIDPGQELIPLEGREQLVIIGVSVGVISKNAKMLIKLSQT